jgi:hypothetical protein
MHIRIEICDTEPRASNGTYVYDTGGLDGTATRLILNDINAFILRSLAEMNALVTKS